ARLFAYKSGSSRNFPERRVEILVLVHQLRLQTRDSGDGDGATHLYRRPGVGSAAASRHFHSSRSATFTCTAAAEASPKAFFTIPKIKPRCNPTKCYVLIIYVYKSPPGNRDIAGRISFPCQAVAGILGTFMRSM